MTKLGSVFHTLHSYLRLYALFVWKIDLVGSIELSDKWLSQENYLDEHNKRIQTFKSDEISIFVLAN